MVVCIDQRRTKSKANPEEVAEVFWMTKSEIKRSESMLPVADFIEAMERNEVELNHFCFES